jgi:hypothetical protein
MLEEFKADTVKKKLVHYKQKCVNTDSRLEHIKYPKQLFDYRPAGRRRRRRRRRRSGQPLKRDYWTDTIVRPKQVIYWPNFVTRRTTRTARTR